MKFPSISAEPIRDRDQHQHGNQYNESDEHLWAKRAVHRGCSNNGEIHVITEQYLGAYRPDCLIEAPVPSFDESNQFQDLNSLSSLTKDRDPSFTKDGYVMQGRVAEIVAKSGQEFVKKTLNYLRCGHVVHWVFLDGNGKLANAHEALDPYLTESVKFGRFDPTTGELVLGDAISFDNFGFSVEGLAEFIPSELKRRGWSLHWGGPMGYNVGEFLLNGDRRRVYCRTNCGRAIHSHPPGVIQEPDGFGNEKYTIIDLYNLVKYGDVKRVGPTAGFRRKRYAGDSKVSNAYLAPKRVNWTCHEFHHLLES